MPLLLRQAAAIHSPPRYSGEWQPSTRPVLLRRAAAHPSARLCGNPACVVGLGASNGGDHATTAMSRSGNRWHATAVTKDDRRLPPVLQTTSNFAGTCRQRSWKRQREELQATSAATPTCYNRKIMSYNRHLFLLVPASRFAGTSVFFAGIGNIFCYHLF